MNSVRDLRVVLAVETAGLAFLAVAASAVTARHGESEPGNLVTSAGALIFVGVLILQPMLHVTWLVRSPEDSAHGGWWAAVMFAAALTFVLFVMRVVTISSAPMTRDGPALTCPLPQGRSEGFKLVAAHGGRDQGEEVNEAIGWPSSDCAATLRGTDVSSLDVRLWGSPR